MLNPSRPVRVGTALLVIACISGASARPTSAIASEEKKVEAMSDARFALDLYGKLKGESANLAFSPFSISTALGMTMAGAKGATLEEMGKVLHRPGDDPATQAALSGQAAAINAAGKSGSVKLVTANALFAQLGEQFTPGYVEMIRDKYKALVESLDFGKDPEGARARINSWVEKQTADKIKGLIPPNMLRPGTSLVLVNAVYFNGTWNSPFKKTMTSNVPFLTLDGSKRPVPMMRQVESLGYVEDAEVQVVSLPYKGFGQSMLVILPKKADGIASVERSLTAEKVDGWIKKLNGERLDLSLPRFRCESAAELSKPLAELGMPSAFSAAADFRGILPDGRFSISAVLHKAYVDVNEEGTEAAAATAVIGVRSAFQVKSPVQFKADHPFLFVIRDESSGAWLFFGRVSDPSR